ncbi:hypothetical protein X975_08352, partial [Stegodyphus mimosarum]
RHLLKNICVELRATTLKINQHISHNLFRMLTKFHLILNLQMKPHFQ